ncbi:MAG: hypothetical protein HY898_27970 [Deltaproteobacteria bacterium]|nr:hypothetical protein [Deltaproteobacteria bacterium]
MFDPDTGPTPCLVVSSDDFNHQALDVVVVLQCVPYVEYHEESPIFRPLGPDGQFPGVTGAWSIGLPLVRGVHGASKTLVRDYRRSLFSQAHPERFGELTELLEYYYA